MGETGESQTSIHPAVATEGDSDSAPLVDATQWVERYGSALFQYAVVRVRCHQTAEDLVQETLLSALEARDRFAGQSSEQTWLIGILSHKIKDYFRKASVRHDHEWNEQTSASTKDFDKRGFWIARLGRWPAAPEQALESREFWAVFDECLSKLDPSLLAAFSLREFDQLATEEICRTLNINSNNLGVRLHRARASLRKCLESKWFEA